MPRSQVFAEDFARLLDTVPKNYTLAQWQHAYRQVIYSMGVKILENFPELVTMPAKGSKPVVSPGKGRHPNEQGGPPGQPPPYRPSGVGSLICLTLGDCPPPP